MRGRSGTGKKAGYPRGGTRMAKSERGKRTRDCNLINPRLEVAQPVDRKRSRSPRNLDRPTRSLWKKGDRSPFIDLPRRSMRPYSPSVRLGWIFTRAHAPTTFSLLLGFINRDRTNVHARIAPAFHRLWNMREGGVEEVEESEEGSSWAACASRRKEIALSATGCNYDANADARIIRRISNEM